jgi:hypothetical protein
MDGLQLGVSGFDPHGIWYAAEKSRKQLDVVFDTYFQCLLIGDRIAPVYATYDIGLVIVTCSS